MKFDTLLTLSGWGLSEKVFTPLPWEQSPLSWEKWLPLTLDQREQALRQALERAKRPVCFMGLSLGGFLAHDVVLRCLDHEQLSGVVFFAIARSFVKEPRTAPPSKPTHPIDSVNPSDSDVTLKEAAPAPTNPYGSESAPLRAMMQPLYSAIETPALPQSASSNGSASSGTLIDALLTNFIKAGISESERGAVAQDITRQWMMKVDGSAAGTRHAAQSLLRGLEFLTTIRLELPSSYPASKRKCPVILFQGTADNIIDTRGVEHFATEAGYHYCALPEAGHFTPFTQAASIEKTLRTL